MPSQTRVWSLILCFIETFLFSGIVFGWASLVYVLKADGIFHHLCPGNTSLSVNSISNATQHGYVCKEQENILAMVDTIAATVWVTICFPVAGICMDRWGIRPLRLAGSAASVSGCLLLAFAEKGDLSWIVIPGTVLLAFQSSVLIVVCSHVATSAGKWCFTVLASLNGISVVSGTVFQIIKILQDNGVLRLYSLSGLAALNLISLMNTWICLPAFKVTPTIEGSHNVAINNDINQEKVQSQDKTLDKTFKSNSSVHSTSVTRSTFKQIVFSWTFTLLSIWFSCMHLRIMTFLGMFNPWITVSSEGDTTYVSKMTDNLGNAMMASAAIAFLPGFVIDITRHHLRARNVHNADIVATVFPFSFGGVMAIFLSVTMIVSSSEFGIWICMVSCTLCMISNYSVVHIFVHCCYREDDFGKLIGLLNTITGVVAILNYPLSYWNTTGHFTESFSVILVLILPTLILPVYLLIRRNSIKKES